MLLITTGFLQVNALHGSIAAVTQPRRCLTCYSGFVDKRAQQIWSSRHGQTASPSFQELAARQGVTPIHDFDALLGKPSHDDESAEEFSASLREWRQEGARPVRAQ